MTDSATCKQGMLPLNDIPCVVVNGVTAVKDSKVFKGVNSGQAVRYEPEAKGRFEPLTVEK